MEQLREPAGMESNEYNLSVRLHGRLDIRLEKQPIPVPSDGEAVIRIRNCGICGTDVHMWTTGLCGHDIYVTDPVVIGHECSGVVHSVADDVKNLKIGDRVAVEIGLPCSVCDFCRRGKYNLCKPFSLGGLTRYLKYNAGFCHRLPDKVTFEEGALIEPLAVGVRACKRASVRIGAVVLICGAGAIGLSCLLVARAMGASAVCLTDISQSRLELASSLGANWTVLVNPEHTETSKELAGRITRTIGCRPDCSIECSGIQSSLQAAIYATKSGGVMAPVALAPTHVDLPMVDAATREVDIRGVFSYCNDYPAAISMLASGRIDPTPMITTRFPLEHAMEAFQRARDRKDGDVKVMINCE